MTNKHDIAADVLFAMDDHEHLGDMVEHRGLIEYVMDCHDLDVSEASRLVAWMAGQRWLIPNVERLGDVLVCEWSISVEALDMVKEAYDEKGYT